MLKILNNSFIYLFIKKKKNNERLHDVNKLSLSENMSVDIFVSLILPAFIFSILIQDFCLKTNAFLTFF